MTRKHIITLHLILAGFLTPILIIIATSGGLYLLGEKGEVTEKRIYQGELGNFNFKTSNKRKQVDQFLKEHNIKQSYDYIKGGGRFMVTRPTSKTHLLFERENNQLIVTRRSPDLVASMIEIHKGHGSRAMKLYQKIVAIGLLLILFSGFYLGVSSPRLRNKTIVVCGAGLFSFLLLAFF